MANGNFGGCLVLIGVGLCCSFIAKSCDKTPPPISQPSTGVVSSYRAHSPAVTYLPSVPEPTATLLSGGSSYSRTAINLTNDMSDAAYVKVLSGGSTYATLYLRPRESYRLSVTPGYYAIRYVTGSSSQWRGEEHHFGSGSEYFAGSTANLEDGDNWNIKLYTRYVRRGTGGQGAPRMSKEGF